MSPALSNPFARPPAYEIVEMRADHAREAAAIHATRFARPWSDGEFQRLLSQPPVFGHVAVRTDQRGAPAVGFVLARATAGEAEILSIGVHERHERRTLGWRLMQAAIREAGRRGAEAMFLEVDETNAGAIALYRNLGFRKVGERRAYYEKSPASGHRAAALVMRLDLL